MTKSKYNRLMYELFLEMQDELSGTSVLDIITEEFAEKHNLTQEQVNDYVLGRIASTLKSYQG